MEFMGQSAGELSCFEACLKPWVLRMKSNRHAAPPQRHPAKSKLWDGLSLEALDHDIDGGHGDVWSQAGGNALLSGSGLCLKVAAPRLKAPFGFEEVQRPSQGLHGPG
jgi:hypothetical protein